MDNNRYSHFEQYAREQANLTDTQIEHVKSIVHELAETCHLPLLVLKNVIAAYIDAVVW